MAVIVRSPVLDFVNMVWGIFNIISTLLALTCAVQFLVKTGIRKVSISFGLGMLSLAVLYFSSAVLLMASPEPGSYQLFFYRLADGIFPLMGAATPFFMLVISRNFGRRDDIKNIIGISTLTRMAGLITIVALYFVASSNAFETSFLDGRYELVVKSFLAKAVCLTLAILLILSLLNFENTRRASRGAMKNQVLAMMIIDIILFAGIVRLFFMGHISSTFLSYAAPINAVVMSWLYVLLLSKDEYSANIVIDRQAFLSSTVILFLGIFLVLTGIIAYVIEKVGGRPDVFMSIIGAFLVIGLFLLILLSDSIRGRFTNAMLSRIYAGRFDYKAEWRELSEDFASCGSIAEMQKLLINKIDRLLKPSGQLFLSVEGDKITCSYPTDKSLTDIKRNDPLAEWIFLKSEPALFADIEESAPGKLKSLEKEYEVLVPIIAERQLIGILMLGTKVDSTSYNNEDFAMLSAISHQAAVTILHLRSRDRLLESEKLASFHKTASFVIHDLKNAISMLSLMVQNAPSKMSDPEFQKESIKTINQAVVRMQRIIEKLKKPPEKEQLKISQLDPAEVLKKAVKKSGVDNKNNIELKFIRTEFQPVKTDPDVLETVFINILINAVEAMPEGGLIEIDQLIIDDRPQILISDTGVGMSRSFIEHRLFKPFETTKDKGLGVGLYQCREMFKEAGGEITVKSKRGVGSTFILVFP